jgi:hypothetical protein
VDGLTNFCPLADYVAQITTSGTFVLVDIGVAGGIDRPWRRFGRRLRAIGIDPSVNEIARLTAAEKNPNVTYVNAFAALPPGHPFAQKARKAPQADRGPWPRLSACQYVERVYSATTQISAQEILAANLWPDAQLAAPETSIAVPEFLTRSAIRTVDFLKIDVDGADFEILQSFEKAFADFEIMGIGIEVNFFGSDCETANSLHNVDRFLRSRGFDLFGLTTRRYSTSALPGRFIGREPGATEFGRAFQGDALYARDLASGLHQDFAAAASPDKILNLVAIFAAFNLPDCAAETALTFRAKLSSLCDVDRILDLLTAQAEKTVFGHADYRRRLDRFAQRPRSFLHTRNPLARAAKALKEEFLKRRGRKQLRRFERTGR